MIAKLTGLVDSTARGTAIIDVNGVGYMITASNRTLTRLAPGLPAVVYVETLVREDAIQLIGFIDDAERSWFRLLTTVQGVGAKAALSILSALEPDALTLAIASGDRSLLARSPGIGSRLAQRIVSELADKLHAINVASAECAGPALSAEPRSDTSDAVAALVGLGFAPSSALSAVLAVAREAEPDITLEALIKGGLARLAPQEPAR